MRTRTAARTGNDGSRARFSQQSLEQPMNLRSKWCLYGLLSWAAMAGIASAQPPGSVRLGAPSAEQLPPPITSMDEEMGQVSLGEGLGYTSINRQFRPRFNVDTRGGGSYGYNPGYTNIGMFVPFAIEGDSAILFVDGRGMITHDGGGGANLGAGWRWWMEDIDRIVGVSTWFDYDNGQRADYSQIGLSFESLGRYIDYRANGYIPIGTRSHTLSSMVDTTQALFQGNSLVFQRTNVVEQTYTGFDAELGGPLPVIGRYGVNGYVGGYHFMGNGVAGGSFTGVSGRFMAQINEDVSFGVQVTDDHVFGTNTQFQVFVTLPEGVPSRWLRNPRVQDRLTQSVYRQGRVMAHTNTYSTFDQAINPKDGLPYFVTHIDPNLGQVGDGSLENPFQSIAVYNGQTVAQQQKSDIIYVRPRADGTSTNLDTAPTFTLYDGQRLLSSSVAHTFMSANYPGIVHNLPGFVPDLLPQLVNSAGADVITLAPGNVQCLEVSGFDITGSAGGSGISGINNSFVLINRNEIHDGFNGINLVNLTEGMSSTIITSNILRDNVNDGFHLLNIGGPSVTSLRLLNNTAYGNDDDGFDIAADVGSTIGGLIASNSTSPINGGSANGDTGLTLSSNGGVLAFNNPLALPVPQQISNNIFSDNSGDGVFVDVTGGGNADLLFLANTIGNNGVAGIHVPASDGSLINLIIGGPDDVLDRNNIAGNGGPGILFDLSNTANGVTTRIENNIISGNLDGIQVNVANTSVFGPAVGLNTTEIFDNLITGNRRDGIRLTRSDSANLNLGTPAAPPIHGNVISGNAENGLSLIATGDNSVPVILSTEDNIFDSNGLDGLGIIAGITGGAVDNPDVLYDSNRDQFTANGRNGISSTSNDLSTINLNLVNVTAVGNTGNGLFTFGDDLSFQNITVTSPIDPLFTGQSRFSNNGANGISINTIHQGLTFVTLDTVEAADNGADGWNMNRQDISLILASATNSVFINNANDGIEFNYTGNPPTDPTQPLTGQFNQLILNNVNADGNGANGFNALGSADSVLVTTFTLSTFNDNAANGILITADEGASFGNPPAPGVPRSLFDGISASGNGQDGIHVDENSYLLVGARVYIEVRTDAANTDIENNGDDGVHIETDGQETDILLNSTSGNLLSINNNGANGVRWDVTSNGSGAGHLVTIDDVLIDSNGGDGIQFNVPSGTGTLVVSNSEILSSGDDGINVNATALGNGNGTSTGFARIFGIDNFIGQTRASIAAGNNGHGVNIQIQGPGSEFFVTPLVQASFTGTNPGDQQIVNSGLNGVNIELRGATGDRFFPNAFIFDGNHIARNGLRSVVSDPVNSITQSNGIFFQETAGVINRFDGTTHRRVFPNGNFDDGNGVGVPINMNGVGPFLFNFNTGNNNPTFFTMSNYMNLRTDLNATMQVTNNIIEFNGTNALAPGEGVFVNISTNAYLSADISGNTFTGNGSADFRSRSFISGGNPPVGTQGATPGANDNVFLDDTAQLDLRLANNTGEHIQPLGPGALYAPEGVKGPGFRNVQVFQVDDSPTGLNTNTFTNLVDTQQNLFLNAGYWTAVTPWSLNNPAFPQDFATNPGNPFLP